MFQVSISKFYEQGIITPLILVIASIMIIFATGLITWSISEHKDASRKIRATQALQIAEAGVNYYKWHLEHDDKDYQDGNGWCCAVPPCDVCGPYEHQYKDYNGEIVGQFSLKITPPEVGSTIAIIESAGYAYGNEDNEKTIISRVGKRSLAEYSWLSDALMSFSYTATVTGPVHSNGEINFRGTCEAEISSSDDVFASCEGKSPCPKDCPESLWRDPPPPVPEVYFDNFRTDLWQMKKNAAVDDAPENETGTCNGYTEGRGICFEESVNEACKVICKEDCCDDECGEVCEGECEEECEENCKEECGLPGYHVVFKKNPAEVYIYKVVSLKEEPWWMKYYNYKEGQSKPVVERIQVEELIGNYDMPDNGLIFLEDDVWVEGTVNGRVTVGVSKLSNGEAQIMINDNIVYEDLRAGDDNLGLVCQGNIIIPRHAPDILTIEASLLSQQGRGLIFRNYSPWEKKIRVENYGGIVTYLRSWVKYGWGGTIVSGYEDSIYTYNTKLAFNPPPSFPTAENFEVLSWEEK